MSEKRVSQRDLVFLFLGVPFGAAIVISGQLLAYAVHYSKIPLLTVQERELRASCIERGGTYSEDSKGRYDGCAGLKHIDPERAP